ncbi:RHS repeat-associated core domain-containing protein [Candidatus Micrarchaeota archaeon]|nr:RHS repeat-associated core domain-containing protein [Candidatus Micrarchaeota archaeon]
MRPHRKKTNDSLQKFLIGVGLIAVVVLMLANSQSGFLGFAFKSINKEVLLVQEETIAISPTPLPTATSTVSLVPIDEPIISLTPSAIASPTPVPTVSSKPTSTTQPNENYPYAAKGLSALGASTAPLQKTYIFAGSLVASFSSEAPEKAQYYAQDHLGSNRKVIGSALEQQTNEFYAFGESDKATGSGNDYKYTGKEFDDESGLYYYGARYYDPDLGRFVSADALQGNLGDPLSLNRYVYVKNNPVKFVDPNGNEEKTPDSASDFRTRWEQWNQKKSKFPGRVEEIQKMAYTEKIYDEYLKNSYGGFFDETAMAIPLAIIKSLAGATGAYIQHVGYMYFDKELMSRSENELKNVVIHESAHAIWDQKLNSKQKSDFKNFFKEYIENEEKTLNIKYGDMLKDPVEGYASFVEDILSAYDYNIKLESNENGKNSDKNPKTIDKQITEFYRGIIPDKILDKVTSGN